MSPKDAYRQANAAVQKSLELDEGLGEAHSTIGMLNWRYAWEMRRMESADAGLLLDHEALCHQLFKGLAIVEE